MNPINYIFIFIIIFIGIKTSISDFKYFKIRNKDIIYGFILGITIYLTLYLLQLYSSQNLITIGYFKQLIINFIFASLIGIGFWIIKFWSAADAKLFILFAFLIPLNFYQNGGIPHFFSFTIIINTFLLLGFYSIFNVIKNKNKIQINLKEIFKIKEIFKFEIVGSFIIIHWILRLFLNFLPNDLFVTFSSFIFLFSYPLFKIFKNHKRILAILILGRMILDKSIYSFTFLFEFVLIIIIFFFISNLIKIIENIFTKNINIKSLKKGMILKYPIVEKNKKYYQLTDDSIHKIFEPQKNKKEKSSLKIFVPKETRGLNLEEYNKIKKIFKKNLIKKNLIIKEHTSFAIYLFIGTLITIICNGSLIYWTLKLFQ